MLIQGDIFLNTSLTEAFCIAIVEAACCGYVISAILCITVKCSRVLPEINQTTVFSLIEAPGAKTRVRGASIFPTNALDSGINMTNRQQYVRLPI